VFFAALNWDAVLKLTLKQTLAIKELPRFPSVMRDISMVVPKHLAYAEVENSVNKLKLAKLQEVKLFDIFESEKLGTDKKSIAVSFTFLDEEKTLTDKEIDGWMNKIMVVLESDLKAEIRK
jgi:phenylalanyl-tRNA synthetase beta chain